LIIDLHLHESKYSPDSNMSLNVAIETAKSIGLDGICVTNHDNNYLRNEIGDFASINNMLVIVGAEILTFEGDILVFGVNNLPEEMIHVEQLLKMVKDNNGVAISAHPFRDNNRGLGDHIRKVDGDLWGIESFNGSTLPHHNLYAYTLATQLGIPSIGASDAHIPQNVGKYATYFSSTIRDYKDFIESIKSRNFCPVIRKAGHFEKINIYPA
jgi:predicted metal-dependent phosphoesterase TrpH